jgi:GAF domain-containing protein
MPPGHLPVRSYLAVPVLSRTGEVLGGLFYGHAQPGMFSERAERILVGLAAQAGVAIDNSRLYQTSVQEVAARRQAEERLQELNRTLEERVAERAQQLAASTVKLQDVERRFRILVEGVTDYAIYMLDPSGAVVNWNPGAERIKGTDARRLSVSIFRGFTPKRTGRRGFRAERSLPQLRPENTRRKAGACERTAAGSGLAS